jgi:hypothetical protein
MKKQLFLSVLAAVFITVLSTQSALAHENRTYQIGNETFQFTVGSLNEPIAVDDKTGVHLKVVETGNPKSGAAEEDHDDASGAVIGLDKTLKVEMSAGDKKKTMDLSPIHGEAGAYRASFIPTVQTTYTYRFFGTVNEKPIDISFTCNPAGHPATPEDTNPLQLSEDVTQIGKRGAFGCPVAKADLGFPEAATSEYDLKTSVDAGLAATGTQADSSRTLAMVGIFLGVLGLGAGVGGLIKNKRAV